MERKSKKKTDMFLSSINGEIDGSNLEFILWTWWITEKWNCTQKAQKPQN